MEEKINALFEDKAFFELLLEKNSVDEVRETFAANGLTLPDDTAEKIWCVIKQIKEVELTGDDLSSVAGGYASDSEYLRWVSDRIKSGRLTWEELCKQSREQH